MADKTVRLEDKFDLGEARQLLTGTQAIVRLALMQKQRDQQAGLRTAGYVTGYRGSPIASLEAAFTRYDHISRAHDILFHPGLNEDLAATAIWGAQQAELRNEGKYDGVFAIWYGKGPGVDRSGDVFRHANHAGTSKHGGVLALMGDDHTCESSTSAHQSEFAFVDAMMPVLNPAGVQEILDYGIYGFALSRFAGVWVGIKCVKDNIESTATVDGRTDRIKIVLPAPDESRIPEGGLNIRLGDPPLAKEARLHLHKRRAMLTFARANGLDRLIWRGGPEPRLGIVSTGKSYLDTRQALEELGIDEVEASRLGIRLYKVAMTWPLEARGIAAFAHGLEKIMVVEEKRSLIETQIKEQLFDSPERPRIIGKRDEANEWLFPASGALSPTDIAIAIGSRLVGMGAGGGLAQRVDDLRRRQSSTATGADIFTRIPYFCAGCPHNRSTVVPEGARAYAGIGCHYMVQWMDRSTEGFTQMGGEGANWIGEAPFSKRRHVFQNLGDGTYIHSGILPIRAAIAAGTNITFKILYNDAVAMTGGQKLDGDLTVGQMAAQLAAEGVKKIAIVTDEPGKYGLWPRFPSGTRVHHRRDIQSVQKALSEIDGVTALIYDQTCAAEKRRRRKRGTYPDPDKRVYINPAVCEGCGDCSIKSNCIAVLPLETEFGRKRKIDQSQCNKDFSCLEGFCPSFVTVHGATMQERKPGDTEAHRLAALAPLPEPHRPTTAKPYTILVTGIGGTGVVTVSAILGEATHIEGKSFGSIDMTGLAQKGGAVGCHIRIADRTEDIHAIRIGVGGADLVLGGDLVVAAAHNVLDTVRPDHTAVILSDFEMITGDFTRHPGMTVPAARLKERIAKRVGSGPHHVFDVHTAAEALFGDAIGANMMLLGMAYQAGRIPLTSSSIEAAIAVNGAAVEMNLMAFRLGRLAIHDRPHLEAMIREATHSARATAKSGTTSFEELLARRMAHLEDFQDKALAQRYEAKVRWAARIERESCPGKSGLAETVARTYHKLLAYKDEYEVARLLTEPAFEADLEARFGNARRLSFHLAPPFIGWLWRDPETGHPRKITVGNWIRPLLRLLARGKALRGTHWDLFGYAAERRCERKMIGDYERLLERLAPQLSEATHDTIVQLAGVAGDVKGFGHIKQTSYQWAMRRQEKLIAELQQKSTARAAAE
ncbi:MAG: hypothetical protein RLZ98_2254 [Pseudomonadota bacterium]|jgi:indolepyruvate ferredoxin oxidoreductase